MHDISERKLAVKQKCKGFSYDEISKRLHISRSAAINLCKYKLKTNKKKPGPKLKLCKASQMRMKRQIFIINAIGQKINSRKLINECELKASSCTVKDTLEKLVTNTKDCLTEFI